MAKRPFPLIPDAYMVPEIELSDERQAEILDAIPLADPEDSAATIAELEEILSDLEAARTREPNVRQAVAQLDAIADSARHLHSALADLGSMANSLLIEHTPPLESVSSRNELSQVAFRLSVRARRAAEEIRPGRGRPPAWSDRRATMAFADLWERRTGGPPTWANAAEDGGAFARFVQAACPDIGLGVIQTTLTARGRKSWESA